MCNDLFDASLRVAQAEAVLQLWLDSFEEDCQYANIIASVMSSLEGVRETVMSAYNKTTNISHEE